MKKIILMCVLVLSLALPALAETQHYGAKISLSKLTEISDIMQEPEEYVGKRVLVEGKVVMICAVNGCWMDVESNKTNEVVHISIPADMFTFTMSAQDRKVHIEGVVERLDMSKEEAITWYKQKAEDAHVDFDPTTVTGPESIYLIKALGAELFD